MPFFAIKKTVKKTALQTPMNKRETSVIIGQTTEDISRLLDHMGKHQRTFVFAKAGNSRKYNATKGKHKK